VAQWLEREFPEPLPPTAAAAAAAAAAQGPHLETTLPSRISY